MIQLCMLLTAADKNRVFAQHALCIQDKSKLSLAWEFYFSIAWQPELACWCAMCKIACARLRVQDLFAGKVITTSGWSKTLSGLLLQSEAGAG